MTIFVLLLTAVVFAGIQAAVLGRRSVSRIRYERRFEVTECYAGDTIEMVEVIENHKWLPVPWIRVESVIDAALRFQTEEAVHIDEGKRTQYHKSLFTLGPYRRIRRRHRITCMKRGVYRLAGVTVTGGDMLGTIDRTRRYPVKARLVVYPQVTAMEDVPLPTHGWQGDVTVKRWLVDDPFTVAGTREYRSGDPMKLIHWKASARTRSLQVYKREFTAEQRLVVMLNVEDRETTRDVVHHEDLIERGISYAATIVSDAVRRGIPVGFGHNGGVVSLADPGEPAGLLGANGSKGAGGNAGSVGTDGSKGLAGAAGSRKGGLAGVAGAAGSAVAAGNGGTVGSASVAGTAGSANSAEFSENVASSVGRVPIGGGRAHLLEMLTEMARIELRRRVFFHDFLAADCAIQSEKRDYILITAHLSEPLQKRIRLLEDAGHSVQVLRIDEEAGEVSA